VVIWIGIRKKTVNFVVNRIRNGVYIAAKGVRIVTVKSQIKSEIICEVLR
jgi:hypothetical protein